MSNSLPHAQKLYEAHGKDERVRIVAVATAFEKEEYPWMADEQQIKAALDKKGWTFPVMRDAEEQSVRIVGMGNSYGTPMTLVLDAEGTVRWHGFNATHETATSVAKTLDRLLESFWVPTIPDLPRALSDYAKGGYGKAWTAAQRILATDGAPDDDTAAATRVVENLTAGVERFLARSAAALDAGRPAEAMASLEEAEDVFGAAAQAAKARRVELRTDDAFKKELAGEKRLAGLESDAAKPKARVSSLLGRTRSLSKTHGDTRLAARIDALIADLETREG